MGSNRDLDLMLEELAATIREGRASKDLAEGQGSTTDDLDALIDVLNSLDAAAVSSLLEATGGPATPEAVTRLESRSGALRQNPPVANSAPCGSLPITVAVQSMPIAGIAAHTSDWDVAMYDAWGRFSLAQEVMVGAQNAMRDSLSASAQCTHQMPAYALRIYIPTPGHQGAARRDVVIASQGGAVVVLGNDVTTEAFGLFNGQGDGGTKKVPVGLVDRFSPVYETELASRVFSCFNGQGHSGTKEAAAELTHCFDAEVCSEQKIEDREDLVQVKQRRRGWARLWMRRESAPNEAPRYDLSSLSEWMMHMPILGASQKQRERTGD